MINNLKFQVRFHAVTSDCTHLLLMFEMDVIFCISIDPCVIMVAVLCMPNCGGQARKGNKMG